MELADLKIPKGKVAQLQNAGISSLEDLMYYFPKKYIDRTSFTGLLQEGESIFLFQCNSVHAHNYRTNLIEAIGTVPGQNIPMHILWYNQAYMFPIIEESKGKQVVVAGTVTYKPPEPLFKQEAHFEVSSPAVYSLEGTDALRIYPVYKKPAGMAEDYLIKNIRAACGLLGAPAETVPEAILDENDLMGHAEMVAMLHQPTDEDSLKEAQARKLFDDLLYFALRLEIDQRRIPKGSIYGIPSLVGMNKVKDSLPFDLTADQSEALTSAIEHIRSGRRLNALLQGDVGSGKTIVAMLLMLAFASNGQQAALMAPTRILAEQHYEDLVKLAGGLNIPVTFIGGGSKKTKQQKAMEAGLADGSIRLVVGTQALLSGNYQFKNLALVIEDEEHKYGVMQRATLTEKVAGGTHVLTMSATPIPRSLAQTIYGEGLQLYTITQKPAGRKPVQTGIAPNADKAISFLRRSCGDLKQQAYVVCPLVAESDKIEGVASTEETFKVYEEALKSRDISVALVTGKTPKNIAKQLLQSFAEGAISVLVSTTVIEVGVNVPNANCIIIHNAERFGLAQLHQLRGRVGRGNAEAFCCLVTDDPYNERLQAMVKTNDGFEIAQMDLQQRGAGDFLGVQQSGVEKHLTLALQNPKEYKQAQKAAKDILDFYADDCLLLEKAQEDLDNQVGGEIL